MVLQMDESSEHESGKDEEPYDLRGKPAIFLAPLRESQEQRENGQQKRYHAGIIDPPFFFMFQRRKGYEKDEERDKTKREINIENPPPVEYIRNEPTHRRSDKACDAEHGCHDAHVFSSLPRREQLSYNDECIGRDDSPANALESSENDELRHTGR